MELKEISCNCLPVLGTSGLGLGGIAGGMHEESLSKLFTVKAVKEFSLRKSLLGFGLCYQTFIAQMSTYLLQIA